MHMDTPEFKLTQTELKLIAEIDEFKGRWQAITSLAPEQLTTLRKVATVESIASSTRIEESFFPDCKSHTYTPAMRKRLLATPNAWN